MVTTWRPPPLSRTSQVAQAGVDRRRLAAAAGPGEQDGAGAFPQQRPQGVVQFRGEPELLQVWRPGRGVEDADCGPFPVDGREGADAHVHAVAAEGLQEAALLWDVKAVGQQFRQDLEPGDHVRGQLAVQGGHAVQHAVQAVTHLDGPVGRLDVDVAGLPADGVGQDQVHQAAGALGQPTIQGIQPGLKVVTHLRSHRRHRRD
jgi:hypothetical protein